MNEHKQSIYMHWAKTQRSATYNLAISDVLHYPMKDLEVNCDELEIHGPTYYGYEPLNELLAQKCGAPTDCIAPALGTSMANHLVLAAILDAGDEVLIEQPTYEPILAAAQYLGAKIKRFPRSFANQFQIDVDALKDAVTPKTKLIVLANLHNPSAVLTESNTLFSIREIAASVDAKVLVDEVYLECLYPQFGERISCFHLGPEFIATASLTKAYGLSGLRCGWILAQPELVQRFKRINDLFASVPPHISELLSMIALKKLDRIGTKARTLLDENRAIVNEFFDDQKEKLEVVRSPFGTTFFPKLKRHDAEPFFKMLRENYDTSVVPGRYFEMPEHFRVGIGGATDVLKEGLHRLSLALR